MAPLQTPWYRGLGADEILATVNVLPGLLMDLIDRGEKLRELVAPLVDRVREVEGELGRERAKRLELQRRLAQSSANSSRPPSLDDDATRRTRAQQREAGKREPGAQEGHPGHWRARVGEDAVRAVEVVLPESCENCGKAIDDDAQKLTTTGKPVIWQQVEWFGPQSGCGVIEFHFLEVGCSACGSATRARWERQAWLGVGPRLQALVVVLTIGLRLSRRQLRRALRMLVGVTLSVGTLQKLCEDAGTALAGPYRWLEEEVRRSYAVNMDETSWRMGLKRLWVWVARTPLVTLMRIADSRGSKEVREILGEYFGGTVMCDRYGAYRWLGLLAYCWAHLERDFAKLAAMPGDPRVYGERLLALTAELFGAWHRFTAGELDREALKVLVAPLREQFKATFEEMEQKLEGWPRTLARNLLRDWEHLFRFVDEKGIEPTNNAAERALRALVIMRKLSYGNRSEAGRRFVERASSVLQTLAQCDVEVLDWLAQALARWRAGQASPPIPGVSTGDPSASGCNAASMAAADTGAQLDVAGVGVGVQGATDDSGSQSAAEASGDTAGRRRRRRRSQRSQGVSRPGLSIGGGRRKKVAASGSEGEGGGLRADVSSDEAVGDPSTTPPEDGERQRQSAGDAGAVGACAGGCGEAPPPGSVIDDGRGLAAAPPPGPDCLAIDPSTVAQQVASLSAESATMPGASATAALAPEAAIMAHDETRVVASLGARASGLFAITWAAGKPHREAQKAAFSGRGISSPNRQLVAGRAGNGYGHEDRYHRFRRNEDRYHRFRRNRLARICSRTTSLQPFLRTLLAAPRHRYQATRAPSGASEKTVPPIETRTRTESGFEPSPRSGEEPASGEQRDDDGGQERREKRLAWAGYAPVGARSIAPLLAGRWAEVMPVGIVACAGELRTHWACRHQSALAPAVTIVVALASASAAVAARCQLPG